MTPLWREIIKPLLDAKPGPDLLMRDLLARARCFDLREVHQLAYETSTEVRRGVEIATASGWAKARVDIGERVCLPAPVTWLEFHRHGILIEDNGVVFAWVVWEDLMSGATETTEGIVGEVRLEDGIASVARMPDADADPTDVSWVDEPGIQTLFMALAGLSIIGSPAARAERIEPHRGFERRLRQAGCDASRGVAHTKVTIGKARYSGPGASVDASPKAYHFCRAHARQRASGRIETVRAHWRGDPAFGIRLPTYRVPEAAQRQGPSPDARIMRAYAGANGEHRRW